VRFKALISALVLTLLLVAAAPAAGAPDSLPQLATQMPEDELQVRPPIVSYTGDGTGFLGGRTSSPPRHLDRGGIDWVSWTQRSAFGRGWVWINDCRPYCAAGHFHKARATVRASRPRDGLFTRLTIAYRWGGRDYRDHRVLEHAAGFYFWGI
jgi:hypothetical protein